MINSRPTRRFARPTILTLASMTLAFVAIVSILSPARADYPKPSLYPVSWQLDFDYQPIKRIVVESPNASLPKAYWYLTYTVTNKTDREQSFLPDFEMMTNDGTVIRSDHNIPAVVFDSIKRHENKKFMEPYPKIAGKLLVGEDQAKDGVAIWEEPNPRMGSFTIYVSGLSGETSVLKDAGGQPMKDAKGNMQFLRKTLEVNFTVPGDEVRPGEDRIVPGESRWIMR